MCGAGRKSHSGGVREFDVGVGAWCERTRGEWCGGNDVDDGKGGGVLKKEGEDGEAGMVL